MHRLAFVAAPLRPAWRSDGARQPTAHHRLIRAFAPFDGRHDRQRALCGMGVHDIAQRAPRLGEILGGDQKFGADKVSAVEIPFAVAIDLGVSEKEPVVLRRCSARQVSELLAWLKEVHTKALTGTEAK